MDPTTFLLTSTIVQAVSDTHIIKTILNSLIQNVNKQEIKGIRVTIQDHNGGEAHEVNLSEQKEETPITIEEVLQLVDKKVPEEASEKFLIKWIEDTRTELAQQRKERRKEANITFLVAVAALTIGILLAFTGIIFIFTINLPTGTVTTASGIITDIVCALAFAFNKEANNRLVKSQTK